MSIRTPPRVGACPACVWPFPRRARDDPVRFAQRTISTTSCADTGAATALGILNRMRPESALAVHRESSSSRVSTSAASVRMPGVSTIPVLDAR